MDMCSLKEQCAQTLSGNGNGGIHVLPMWFKTIIIMLTSLINNMCVLFEMECLLRLSTTCKNTLLMLAKPV